MSPKEYQELLEYVRKNNSWGINMYATIRERNRKAVKYVDCCFDTRDGTIWNIIFRSVTGEKDKSFRIETPEDIKKIYSWLDTPLHEEK